MSAKSKSSDGESKSDSDAPNFDTSLGRLEELVAELEEGGLGLEESLERYKSGIVLLKDCRQRLAGFRAQVEELTKDGLQPHEGDPDVADAPY